MLTWETVMRASASEISYKWLLEAETVLDWHIPKNLPPLDFTVATISSVICILSLFRLAIV